MTNTDVILQYLAHKKMDEYEFRACAYCVCWLFMSRFSCHYYDVLLLCATRMLRWLQKLLKVCQDLVIARSPSLSLPNDRSFDFGQRWSGCSCFSQASGDR